MPKNKTKAQLQKERNRATAAVGDAVAKDLASRVFEFGMTQSFLGQTDGTSRSAMG